MRGVRPVTGTLTMPLAVALMGYAATLMLEPAAAAVSNSLRRIIHRLQAIHIVIFTPSCAAAGQNVPLRNWVLGAKAAQ